MKKIKYTTLLQFIKFGFVGVSNTLISYGVEMLCYYVVFAGQSWPDTYKIGISSILAFFVSVTNSFYWNNKYVFVSENKKSKIQIIVSYLKTVAAYGVTGIVLAPLFKMWLSGIGVPYWLCCIIALVFTVPLNFILNKLWAFRNC